MPEAYPKSNPWPYVLSALLLFGLALVPPTQWPAFFHDFDKTWVNRPNALATDPLASPSRYQAPNSRVVIGNDPLANRSIVESESLDVAWLASDSVVLGSPSGQLRKSSHGELGVGIPDPLEISNSQFKYASPIEVGGEKVAARDADSGKQGSVRRSVWTPPPGWKPSLIQPFTALQMKLADQEARKRNQIREDESREPQWPEPVIGAVLPIMGPVAKQESLSGIEKQRRAELDSTELAYPPLDYLPPKPTRQRNLVPLVETEMEAPAIPESVPKTPAEDLEKGLIPNLKLADSPTSSSESWGRLTRLEKLLDVGAHTPLLAQWASQLQRQIAQLRQQPVVGTADQLRQISNLRSTASLPANTRGWDPRSLEAYWRIRHSVIRHADIWWTLASLVPTQAQYHEVAAKQLGKTTTSLMTWLTQDPETLPWLGYLQLDELQNTLSLDSETTNDLKYQAENTLKLLHSPRLGQDQQQFLRSQTVFRDLDQSLRSVIATSMTSQDVLDALSEYEDQPSAVNAQRAIAKLQRFSADQQSTHRARALETIDAYYRNANFRISVSEPLVNRLVPAFHKYAEQVNDTILGAAVRGQNSTMTNLSVRFIPDPKSIRVGFFANGQVASSTTSRKGPVVMYNQGTSKFAAEKELSIGPRGIYFNQTETRAVTGTRVVGMRTDLDGFPFLGAIIRSIAKQQASDQRPFLRAEILRRVRRSASRKMDIEVQRRLGKVEQRVQSRILEPLQEMELDPRSMEMRTTKERVILRARLAGPLQLGAHGPRPQARADSHMSLQLHQTAANNWLNQLALQGRRMTLGELANELSDRFRTKIEISEKRKDAVVEFAQHLPGEFEFQDGHIKFTIHLAELTNGQDRWKNLSVCVHYRADAKRLEVDLIRDGGIELATEHLGLRDQIVLRSIFTKVFDANPRLSLLRNAIEQQTSLRDLAITQLTIRDGWICLALGEANAEAKPGQFRVANQPTRKSPR